MCSFYYGSDFSSYIDWELLENFDNVLKKCRCICCVSSALISHTWFDLQSWGIRKEIKCIQQTLWSTQWRLTTASLHTFLLYLISLSFSFTIIFLILSLGISPQRNFFLSFFSTETLLLSGSKLKSKPFGWKCFGKEIRTKLSDVVLGISDNHFSERLDLAV